MKFYGNIILITLICIVIFWAFMALRPAHARTNAVVGKPRVVTTVIQAALLPPPQYDKRYDGELEIRFFSNVADVQQACINTGSGETTGCTMLSVDHKHCSMFLASEDMMKRKGKSYAFVLRHELAHCNGWKHPKTTEGKKFNVGDMWDKAEGAKWIALNTKMPMPMLPALTRILPAFPPVVCVTPDWKQEPCDNRNRRDDKLSDLPWWIR
jgi:hypothetical protein